jgi:hypothetical protein
MNEVSDNFISCKISKFFLFVAVIKYVAHFSRVVAETKKMKIGSPLDRSTQVNQNWLR